MSRSRRKNIILIVILFVFLLVGAYLGVSYYYQHHFFPGTIVSGIDCGGKDAAYLEKINTRNGEDYLISIHDRLGNKYNLKGMDFDYTYIKSGEEQELLDEQAAFLWPLELSKDHKLTLEMSYSFDEEKLKQTIGSMKLFSDEHEAPADAYLKKEDDGSYSIVPEVMGDTPVASAICDEITAAVREGSNDYTLTNACYVPPAIFSGDAVLTKELEQIDIFIHSTVHYEIDDADENLTSNMISDMLQFHDDHTVTLDEEKVADYVQHLASAYNTFGDVRKFKTTLGQTIKIGGGDYGWVIDKAAETRQLMEDLQGGVPVSRAPIYEQTAMKSGINDIGSTYVELDYSNQHLYYYEGGNLKLESDFVSGTMTKGEGSPDGVFKVVYKESPAVLTGEDYRENVEYFMPFAYNVGFHDSSWRTTFGGDIYKKSGSHGCINLPKETAKSLYKMLAIGTPVVAYYREKVKISTNSAKISNAYSYVEPKKKKNKKNKNQN